MYTDPILKKIVDLMDAEGPKELKGRWSVGDSLAVPKGTLPRAFISYDRTAVSDIAQGELRTIYNVVITVAVDMTREFSVAVGRSDAHLMVVEFLEAKDPDSLLLKNDSILGVLRKNQDLGAEQNLWIETGTETTVEYGVGIEKRGVGIMTAEGVLRFAITHDQVIPPFSR